MSSLPRFLALSLTLLLALVVAALGAQTWLRQQEQRLMAAAAERLQVQVRAAAELTGRLHAGWTPERLADMGRIVGAEVQPASPGEAGPAAAGSSSPVLVEVAPDQWLAVQVALPAIGHAHLLLQRVLLALGVFAVLLLAALAAALAARRPADSGGTRAPFLSQQRDVMSLAQLAKTSASQQVELDRERDERLRAEAEARLRLQLLNRALEEKIRIGHDLHDGVIQSLYAAGLTLQSSQPLAQSDALEAGRRIETALDMINRTIAEIRAYIGGLSPLSVRGTSIARALQDVVEELRAGRPVQCDLRIDEAAAARLSDEQMTQTLQIAREAVSNALRHGRPSHLRLLVEARDAHVALQVEDDGQGFTIPPAGAGGHGLANMRARAEGAGSKLQLESTPGRGTRLLLLWPAPVLP